LGRKSTLPGVSEEAFGELLMVDDADLLHVIGDVDIDGSDTMEIVGGPA
jgi:hypothetical protein